MVILVMHWLKTWFRYLDLLINVNILFFHWVYFTFLLDQYIELNVYFIYLGAAARRSSIKELL